MSPQLQTSSQTSSLIGYKDSSGAFYVKQGSLSGGWTQEVSSGVKSFAVASEC